MKLIGLNANVVWYLDVGVFNRATTNLENLHINEVASFEEGVFIDNGKFIPIINSEESSFKFGYRFLKIKNALHIPEIEKNLLSINKFCKDNCVSMNFNDVNVSVKDRKTNENLLTGGVKDGIFHIELEDHSE